jgi:cytochrome c2
VVTRKLAGFVALLAIAASAIIACSDPIQPTATPPSFAPTPALSPDRGASGQQFQVSSVPVSAGDPVNGESLFVSQACSGCHRTDSEVLTGPGMSGIAERAGERNPQLTADEYLTESIRNPTAFVVEGFDPLMPSIVGLTDQDVADLISYLKSLP